MFSKVVLAGHLTRDPESRTTPAGKAVVNFCVAVNRVWTDESGQRRDEAAFVDCTAWKRQAEVIAQHFRKGSPILVEGELRTNAWEHEGQKRSKLYVLVEGFTFLQPKQQGAEPTSVPSPAPAVKAGKSADGVPF